MSLQRQCVRARDTLSGSLCFAVYVIVIAFYRWLYGCVDGKPCWVLIEDTFKKAYFEDWQLVKDGTKLRPRRRRYAVNSFCC